MAVFFTGWELWQDMTFVLACCIVVVFAVGVIKLWWTNRQLRKYETMDDERRARLAEMRHCGIDALGASEIPFGVRALESGVEVEGIWISRSNTPDDSHMASSATLLDERTPATRDKAKQRTVEASATPTPTPSPGYGDGRAQSSAGNGLATLAESSSEHQGSTEADWQSISSQPRSTDDGREGAEAEASHDASRDWISSAFWPLGPYQTLPGGSGQHGDNNILGEAALYGAAEVYANRKTRRLNPGFEVLPAGVLGPRHEFLAQDSVDEIELVRGAQSKLRKKPPR